MNSYKAARRISAGIVFLIAAIVYIMTAERTGSLWDCGEFILGAHKLQVVHPPGASLFVLIGRFFTMIAELVSDDPRDIAFAVNIMSGLFTAAGAGLASYIAMIFGKKLMPTNELSNSDIIALSGAGIVAGLTTAFATSVWFSAVEGEVYALSTFFTILTFWAAAKWYELPNETTHDRWLIFVAYAVGLSSGVHLLSLLTFPAIALLVYNKKAKTPTLIGSLISLVVGMVAVVFVMKGVIAGIPGLWESFEIPMVNDMGMPYHSGLIPVILLVVGLAVGLMMYAKKTANYYLSLATMAAIVTVIGFSTIGVVVIRANADTPVNMNVPSDATRLLPYLNREQYGERPLLRGPHYMAAPQSVDREDRYGQVDGKYEIVDEKFSYVYAGKDKIMFPRIGHTEGPKRAPHNQWRKYLSNGDVSKKPPGQGYNMKYMWNYQFNWMYWRYFAWNFIGRQNGKQGYAPWDVTKGNWVSGIKFIDDWRLFDSDNYPEHLDSAAHNKYFFIPFILGMIGFFFQLKNRPKDFSSILILFLITGLGIILYSNQPPEEPRERDYVLAGSMFAFALWVGLAVVAIYNFFKKKYLSGNTMAAAGIGAVISILAPAIMLQQNFDDHDRSEHTAASDYAANFLESCEPNSILFTYGDNDTYPVWYAQEVEGIRRDVRVVNLSLIAVDWYINKLRRKVNDSEPLKLSIPESAYRGIKRNQLWFVNGGQDAAKDKPIPLAEELKFISSDRSIQRGRDRKGNEIVQYYMRTRKLFIPIDSSRAIANGNYNPTDSTTFSPIIPIQFKQNQDYITKAELAMLDILVNNINDRPIYYAITSNPEKMMGLDDYTQMEGLGLRLVPVRSESDRSLYIYGSGRVDADQVYDNVMNKWKWGNLNTHPTYFSSSYAAEVQAMKMVMLRAAVSFSENGQHQKAADLANKYFEVFPAVNFPYDSSIYPFIDVLIRAKDYDSAEKHVRILAETADSELVFIETLDENDFTAFQDKFQYSLRSANDILRDLSKFPNDSFVTEMTKLLGRYDIKKYQDIDRLDLSK